MFKKTEPYHRTIDQFKERNKRLEQESKQFQGEIENAKTVVKQKEEESRSKDKEIQDSKQVGTILQYKIKKTRKKVNSLMSTFADIRLCEFAIYPSVH